MECRRFVSVRFPVLVGFVIGAVLRFNCLGHASVPNESLGQSSRRTSLVISEIMYHPADTPGTIHTNAQGIVTNSLEFVEIFNSRGEFQDLSGYQLDGDIHYTFPAGTLIQGRGFVVVA